MTRFFLLFLFLQIVIASYCENDLKVITIGEVQGNASNADEASTFPSPFAGKNVTIRGIVFQVVNGKNGGFFLQNSKETCDKKDGTSDGIYVYMGNRQELRGKVGKHVPKVGDEITIKGNVEERYGNTQISNPSLLKIHSRAMTDWKKKLQCVEINPPDEISKSAEYFEAIEGMYCKVPKGSIAQGSPKYGAVYLLHPRHSVAKRKDKYARRIFRDAHPLDNVKGNPFDDGNGMRFLLETKGEDSKYVRTFSTLKDNVFGAIYFSYDTYKVVPSADVVFKKGADPYLNSPPEKIDRKKQYSVASYNLRNLYDYRDDPDDQCDFKGNKGKSYIKPPFNYLPSSKDSYEKKLHALAEQITEKLFSPDIIFIQEAEDQDILEVKEGKLVEGKDNKIDCLQELALVIKQEGGASYATCVDLDRENGKGDGADLRGITNAFLYRTDRVSLPEPKDSTKIFGKQDKVQWDKRFDGNSNVQNPKCFNGYYKTKTPIFVRSPQLAHFRIWKKKVGKGSAKDLFALCLHFRASPREKIEKRRNQALFAGAVINAIQKAYPKALVIAGGDLNIYPRPDDPFFKKGEKVSDQLKGLYDAKDVSNLFGLLVKAHSSSAYTYVFKGQAGTLDQFFVSKSLLTKVLLFNVAHINADYPDRDKKGNLLSVSDHDPIVATFSF